MVRGTYILPWQLKLAETVSLHADSAVQIVLRNIVSKNKTGLSYLLAPTDCTDVHRSLEYVESHLSHFPVPLLQPMIC